MRTVGCRTDVQGHLVAQVRLRLYKGACDDAGGNVNGLACAHGDAKTKRSVGVVARRGDGGMLTKAEADRRGKKGWDCTSKRKDGR